MHLPARQKEVDRVAQRINKSVNFGAQSATGATNRLVRTSFFGAPALC
jgi:hypothetical protein